VTPADVVVIESSGLRLEVDEGLPCTTQEICRIFGSSTLARVLMLSIAHTAKGALVSWQ
jgi:hypothetical protein